MVETFAELEARPKFHSCNIQAVANIMQVRTEEKFNRTFETIVAYDDFAQKVHFSSDLICKVELGGRYMLAYANAGGIQEPQLPPVNGMPQAGPVTEAAQRLARDYKIEI
ncbi:ground-like domain protein [Ostertagia ostertagi]